jgi:ubiquinone/menaquinone biosynthesis C-methylase UbiE
MKTADSIKNTVRQIYGNIAEQNREQNAGSCCGVGGCTPYTIFAEDYSNLEGYNPDADLGLGCGLPTQFAQIKPGDTVVDLGSGAGNDCFIARSKVGESGKVIGVDMTPAMIEKAEANAKKMGFTNVQFRLGEIENLPIGGNQADVVISNCVLNLVPDKRKAFSEIFRILKPGGSFSISDVVLVGKLPEGLQEAAELYAGCVAGALQKEEYLQIVSETGFENIKIMSEKQITLPLEAVQEILSPENLQAFLESGVGIFSLSVYAEKPVSNCCMPGCC